MELRNKIIQTSYWGNLEDNYSFENVSDDTK